MLLVTSSVWIPVVKEPVVCDGSAGVDTLIADLYVRGVWESQTKALQLFDIIIVDTDAHSYHAHSP